jgi:hypothetical protein
VLRVRPASWRGHGLLSVGTLTLGSGRSEIGELRQQGNCQTHEDVEREQREAEEAYRRSQQGLIGKLKGLVAAKG